MRTRSHRLGLLAQAVPTFEGMTDMADVAFILLTVAFFAAVALLARRSGDRDPS